MLLDFLYELRRRRLAVGLDEWLGLMEALAAGLHESSLSGFYHLARAVLCHSEASFDLFDEAFLACFRGLEREALDVTDEILAFVADPQRLGELDPDARAALAALSPEELRHVLAERLAEQRRRHDGGAYWIGTGGTSPLGQGGAHPSGLRIGGGGGGGRSAILLAAERRFRAYRRDLVLDVRQIQVALRRLRELRRDGRRDELDLDGTVDRTARNAGELELAWRAPRRNDVKLLLMMDVGGSMDPHVELVSRLFSAAAQSRGFRDFHAFYFHNCVYTEVYHDATMRQGLPVAEILATYGPSHKLVLVGDAMMAWWELHEYAAAADYFTRALAPGFEWLRRLARHFERAVWLNPEPPRFWRHETVRSIRGLFPMFPLTLAGLEDAIRSLVGARVPLRPAAAVGAA